MINGPVIDGGIDSGGNIPMDQINNTIPIVTPDPVPKPVVVADGNAGNDESKKKNFRWTETINIPYNVSDFPQDFVASSNGIQSIKMIFNNATIRREEDDQAFVQEQYVEQTKLSIPSLIRNQTDTNDRIAWWDENKYFGYLRFQMQVLTYRGDTPTIVEVN